MMNFSRRSSLALSLAATVLALSPGAVFATGYGGGGGGATIGSGGTCFMTLIPPPGGFKADVEDGTDTVKLTFNASNASRMAVSESPTFDGASQETYSQVKTVTLKDKSTGHKTIYVRFYNDCGVSTDVVKVEFDHGTSGSGRVLGAATSYIEELASKIRYGTRSPNARLLQEELAKAGFMPANWKTTDYYGPTTNYALRIYRNAVADLAIDLDGLLKTTKLYSRSSKVALIQRALRARGFLPKNFAPTGYWGPITQAAIQKYLATK